MPEFPINHKMPNGATVADWLGTAAIAARVAVTHIEDVRGVDFEHHRPDAFTSRAKLNTAERQLEQALEEVRAVRAETAPPERELTHEELRQRDIDSNPRWPAG